ncbi:hypothetical protein N9189_00920 [Pirellulaceae bacterium]|jgi:hypothetical protein|nr:hypothetical protein [Pirellulaceae bacterium]
MSSCSETLADGLLTPIQVADKMLGMMTASNTRRCKSEIETQRTVDDANSAIALGNLMSLL